MHGDSGMRPALVESAAMQRKITRIGDGIEGGGLDAGHAAPDRERPVQSYADAREAACRSISSIAFIASPELLPGDGLAEKDFDGGESRCSAAESRRAVGPVGGGEGGEGDHVFRARCGRTSARESSELHAVRLLVGLEVDLLDAAAVDEVVDVLAAPGGLAGVLWMSASGDRPWRQRVPNRCPAVVLDRWSS